MQIAFIYGPPAAGKLTIARVVAERTGWALFHNHLVVDAVAAVFPFGSESFVRIREQFWLATFAEAARVGRSLIFTFAPEPTVSPSFPARAQAAVEAAGGSIVYVALTVRADEQERRLTDDSRAVFGKLRSLALLREQRDAFDVSMAAMPTPRITIDTGAMRPDEAAESIIGVMLTS